MAFTCDKENEVATPKLITKKSYSILGPINNTQKVSPNKLGGQRIISESTGLVKFSLSPNKLNNKNAIPSPDSSPSPIKSGLPVYVPVHAVEEVVVEAPKPNYDQLLEQYFKKQNELTKYEKKVECIKFELLELSATLEEMKASPFISSVQHQPDKRTNSTSQNNDYINKLRKKASNIFVFDQHENLKKKASTIFQKSSPTKNNSINNISAYINKVQDQLSNNLNEMTIKEDVKKFINKQSNEFDEFTFKTSKMVNGLLGTISDKKNADDIVHTSYNFDNLESTELSTKEVLCQKSDESTRNDLLLSASTDIIDIDDYDEDSDY